MKNAFIILLCCLVGLALADESKLRIGISGTDKKQIGQLTKSLENCFTIVDIKAPNVAANGGKKPSDLCDLHITAENQRFVVVDTRNNLELVNMRHWPDDPKTTVEIIKVAAEHYRNSEPAIVVTMKNQTIDYVIRSQYKQLSPKAEYLFEALRKDPRILFLRQFYHPSAFERKDKDSGHFHIIEKSLPLRGRFAATSDKETVDLVIYFDNRQNFNLDSYRVRGINRLSRSQMEEEAKRLIDALLKLKTDQEKRANSEAARLFAEYKELRRDRNTFQEAVSKLIGAVALEPDNVVYRYEELECHKMIIVYARSSGFLQKSNERLQKMIAFKHDFPDFNQPIFKNRSTLDEAPLANLHGGPKKEELADYAAFCDIWRPLYIEELLRLEFGRFDPDADLQTFEDLRQYSLFSKRMSFYRKYYDTDKWLAERYAVSLKVLELMNKFEDEKAIPKKIEENFLLLPMNTNVLFHLRDDKEKLRNYMDSLEEYLAVAASSPRSFYQTYAEEIKYVRKLVHAPRTKEAFEPILKEYFDEYQRNPEKAEIWKYVNLLYGDMERLKKQFVSKEEVPKKVISIPDFTTYNSPTMDHIFSGWEISQEKKDYFHKANSDFDVDYHSYKEVFGFPFDTVRLNAKNHQNNLYLVLMSAKNNNFRAYDWSKELWSRAGYTMYLGITEIGAETGKRIELPFKTALEEPGTKKKYPKVTMAVSSDYLVIAERDNLGVYDLKKQTWSVFDDFIGDNVHSIAISGDRIYLFGGSNQISSMVSLKADGSDRRIHFNSLREEKISELDRIRAVPQDLHLINDKEMILVFASNNMRMAYFYDIESDQAQLLWEKNNIYEYLEMKLYGKNLYMRVRDTNGARMYRINLADKSVEETLHNNYHQPSRKRIGDGTVHISYRHLFNEQFLWGNGTIVNMKDSDDKKKLYLPSVRLFEVNDDMAAAVSYRYIFTIKRKQQ